jgi:hypothetical protein
MSIRDFLRRSIIFGNANPAPSQSCKQDVGSTHCRDGLRLFPAVSEPRGC